MRHQLLFKLDQNPAGRGLRCDGNGLFLGRDALLRRDGSGRFRARPAAELENILGRAYRGEMDWASRVRSVELVAKALNSGDMARATMTAVLMRLPDPGDSFRIASADDELAKAGFNPDEPRDERGRWTDEEGSEADATFHDPRVQLAYDSASDASDDPAAQAAARAAAIAARHDIDVGNSRANPANSEHSNIWDALGSLLSHDLKSALSRIGQAQILESDANLAVGNAEANVIMSALNALAHYRTSLWPDPDGRTVDVPILDVAPASDEGGATIGRPLLPPSAPLMRPRTNADWIDPLINLLSLDAIGTGAAVRLARPAAEVADVVQVSTNAAEQAFETTEGVAVSGSRAIDRGASYESVVRRMYGDMPLSQRGFDASVDGKEVIGRADNTTTIDGKLTAVEAKYVDTWTESLRNPASNAGAQPWGLTEQQQMVRQAKAYSSGFPGGVVYHTNSVDLATYYTQVFRRAGIKKFRFVITPTIRLSKTMPRNSMERIFGEGAFEYERKIAGTRPGEDATVRYVRFDDPASISDLFYEVLGKIQPRLMKSGGAVLEGTRLTLPDGRRFFAIVFHDDIDGWRQQIERGASELGRATARVLDGNVIVSDGQSCPLSNCEAEFD